MANNIYTNRKIGIFTDAHALLEPTIAVLEDMKKNGINEIYSLGDNVGVGPNPSEVMNLLRQYGVISLAGNSEDYCTLGIEPFKSYFYDLKIASQLWTLSKLNEEQIGTIKLFPHFIEIILGGESIALCHFANDVRFDFKNNTWAYQDKVSKGEPGHKQFMHTNSLKQKLKMEKAVILNGKENPDMGGIMSAKKDPLFDGKKVNLFKAVIQGHVHWKIYEESKSTRFFSIRAVGMAYGNDKLDTASYVVLKEKVSGSFDLEEVLVRYDRTKMINSILNSDSPDHTIEGFTGMSK